MPTRREFFKQAALLSSAAALSDLLAPSIQRAHAIDPAPGSTFLDAEHVVILMQENRSFDHAYGLLRGVRGFNDPRALTLASGNPVWVQTDSAGESYGPYRFDIKGTNVTWMGSLPHSWTNQVDAANRGLHDKWLDAKRSGEKAYAAMPLTMGHFGRDDIPFYYALADAFTICDQHFCSSLTGTTPNRLHLWTGTIRPKQSPEAMAYNLNEYCDLGAEVSWPTFPERLEKLGVSWKTYQNELYHDVGLEEADASWLSNFGDNPLEYFTQYRSRFSPAFRRNVDRLVRELPREIAALEKKLDSGSGPPEEAAKLKKKIAEKGTQLQEMKDAQQRWSDANWNKLSPFDKAIHERGFVTNSGDASCHEMETLKFRDGETERELRAPKGDLFHQFRQDVERGELPTVSWLVAPETLSDHPCSAWYGAWYIAEALDILTKNPEVWKKTIFILTYDENDGYFDHVPPFQSPKPGDPTTGKVSAGVDAALEYVTFEEELKYKPRGECRDNSIGLGFRVPLVIASPWSRGGWVCSQVFDHTSSIQFLEKLLTHKTKQEVREPNVNSWRRTVCGDLASAFRPAEEGPVESLMFDRDKFFETILDAKYKKEPSDFRRLTPEEIGAIRQDPRRGGLLPRQEKGTRPSTALPYELAVDGNLDIAGERFVVSFEARNKQFGDAAAGAPFIAYARTLTGEVKVRFYAVAAGDRLEDYWELAEFGGETYFLEIHGPNGFFREFQGNLDDPQAEIRLEHRGNGASVGGYVQLQIVNHSNEERHFSIRDLTYSPATTGGIVKPGSSETRSIGCQEGAGWYDVEVTARGTMAFRKRYAGRVETGRPSVSDPAMGNV